MKNKIYTYIGRKLGDKFSFTEKLGLTNILFLTKPLLITWAHFQFLKEFKQQKKMWEPIDTSVMITDHWCEWMNMLVYWGPEGEGTS